MSWFSSANGVVFPTLIPTVPDISAQVGGASVTTDDRSHRMPAHGNRYRPLSAGRKPDRWQVTPRNLAVMKRTARNYLDDYLCFLLEW